MARRYAGSTGGVTSGLLLRQVQSRDGQRRLYAASSVSDRLRPARLRRKYFAANMLHTPVGVEIVKNSTDKERRPYIGFRGGYRDRGTGGDGRVRVCREGSISTETFGRTGDQEFDQYGNPMHIVATGQPETHYDVWRYRGMYPVARY